MKFSLNLIQRPKVSNLKKKPAASSDSKIDSFCGTRGAVARGIQLLIEVSVKAGNTSAKEQASRGVVSGLKIHIDH